MSGPGVRSVAKRPAQGRRYGVIGTPASAGDRLWPRGQGRHTAGTTGWALLGATYLYLGVAALTIPDHDGSWGVLGGGPALVAGVAYLALVIVERRRGDAATVSQAA